MEVIARISHPKESLETVLQMAVAGELWEPKTSGEAVAVPHRARRSHHRLTGPQLTDLLEGYEDGIAVNQLAQDFGIHRTTVLSLARRAGAGERYRTIDRNLAEAYRCYVQGWSLARIAQGFGVDASTVWRAFQRAGLPTRRPWEHG